MANLFYDASRFIIAILFALYTAGSLFALRRFGQRTGKFTCSAHYAIFFVIHLSCYCVLCLQNKDYFHLIFFGIQQLFFIGALNLYRILYPTCNQLLLNHMFLLMGTGLVVITRLSRAKAIRQFIIIAVSLVVSVFIPALIRKWKFLKKLTWVYAVVGLVAISTVLVLGSTTNGSKISYTISGITFQPSEFVKILFVLFLAGALAKKLTVLRFLTVTAVSLLYVGVLVLSKDLGSGVIFFVAYLFMLFIATGRKRCMLFGGILGVSGAALSYKLFYHVKVRVIAWLNPWNDITGKGYQMAQSLFAIGTGSWFGMGLCQGMPTTIPYVEADFIFSAIAEELGVLYALCLVLVCVACFVLGMGIAIHTKDRFYKLVASGISVTYLFQVLLTIGGGTKFIPLTGVTLPLVSYGGSSVMTTILMFAILQGIRLVGYDEEMEEEAEAEITDQAYEEEFEEAEDESFHETLEGTVHAEEDAEEYDESDTEQIAAHRTQLALGISVGIFGIVFSVLLGYLFYFMIIQKKEIVTNPYNAGRQEILASRTLRGSILTEDGDILAYTKVDENGEEVRVYPYANQFAHTVGYATQGRMGIEALANYDLITSHENLMNQIQNDLSNKKDRGDSVITTLDLDLQQAAYQALLAYEGTIIVTEVSTGKILAMVSRPDFDPNEIDEIWEELIADEESSVLLNRATQGLYPPGSTFKILTALEYIRENPEDYENYTFYCNGNYEAEDGTTVHCYNHHAHGSVGFEESFAYSCNSSFANIGMSLDRDAFSETLNDLLFNQTIPGAYTSSRSSIVMDETLSEYAMMQTAIGQGRTLMTPMHLHMLTAAIANEGVLMEPYLISAVESCDGNTLTQYEPQTYGRLMSADEADILTELMMAVCDYGTARKLNGESYTIAGKTGSAEYGLYPGEDGTMQSHAWFSGFAPADNPEIAVTVIIESAGTGGDYAVPMARMVFTEYFANKEQTEMITPESSTTDFE